MKKYMSICVLVLIVLVLLSCAKNEDDVEKSGIITDTNAGYEIEMIDGQYYLVFEDEKYKNNVNASQVEPYLTFSSVAEMKDKVLNGKLTEEEIKTMSTFTKDSASKIRIPNLEKVYTPIVPENITCSASVWMNSVGYSVELLSKDCYVSLFEVQSKERYEEKLKETKDKLHNNKLVTITKTEQTDDRDATVYWYTTSSGELKKIEYTIVTEKAELFVTETYCLRLNHDLMAVSDTIPQGVQIHGNLGDRYFYCSVYECTERPSVEWLSSFGLAEVK
ncbi:MAG: hypothetical protein E7616_08300 [Ruminococcaceae bacterium]|nr:hypothetical protein [Oscillospiraceae bacterium]